MARSVYSFFFYLRGIDNMIVDNSSVFPAEVVSLFRDLTSFIEEASWTTSQSARFICQNWRLTPAEITDMWNRENPQNPKTNNTFRSQVSTCCANLYTLLGSDILEIFSVENFSADGSYSDEIRASMYRLKTLLDYFSCEDITFNELVTQEVISYANGEKGLSFSLDECSAEIEAIKTFRRDSVFSYLDTLDMRKLAYLKSVLNTPLMSTATRKANVKKVELMKRIDAAVCERFSSFANLGLNQNIAESAIETEPFVSYEDVSVSDTDFSFDSESDVSFDDTVSTEKSIVENPESEALTGVSSEELSGKTVLKTMAEPYDIENIVNKYCIQKFGCNLQQVGEMIEFSKSESAIFSKYHISSASALLKLLQDYAKLGLTKPAMSDESLQSAYNKIGLSISVTHDTDVLNSVVKLLLADNLKIFLAGFTSGDVSNVLNIILPVNPDRVFSSDDSSS